MGTFILLVRGGTLVAKGIFSCTFTMRAPGLARTCYGSRSARRRRRADEHRDIDAL
jgi:hypothetical protein